MSSPMWNWSIPHALKPWIDVIVQPLRSFTFDFLGSIERARIAGASW